MLKQRNTSLTTGNLFSSMIAYTIPIILTGILQLLFNAADLIVVGRFCGSLSVGAVGATGSLTNLLVNLFMGLSVGTGVVVAQSVGAKDDEGRHRAVHTAMVLAPAIGLILTIIGVVFCEPLLRLMNTPENILPLSAKYMKIYFSGITFTLVYNFAASILRAVGDTKSPLIFLVIAGVINVVLNVLFVTVFHMNVAGVALATMISQAISAILVVIALVRRDDSTRLFFSKMRIYKEQLLRILKIGIPAGIQASLFSISNVIIQASVNSFGDAFVSGSAAASNIENFVYIVMNSFYQTTLNFTGQNFGAKKMKRVKEVFKMCLVSVMIVGLALGIMVFVFGRQLLGIYITDSAAAIEAGMQKLALVGLPYFLCGMMEVTTGALRGIGSSFVPMIISILGICGIRIVWVTTVFQLPQFHTPEWLFASYIISWIFTLVCQAIAFFILFNKKKENIENAAS